MMEYRLLPFIIGILLCLLGTLSATAQKFEWAKAVGGVDTEASRSIAVDGNGNTYTTGGFQSTADFDPGPGVFNLISATTGNTDIFITKMDASGNLVWAKSIGGYGYDIANSIALDNAGYVYTTGFFDGFMVDFDPGPDTFPLTSTNTDIFISKLDTAGNFVWAKSIGGPNTHKSNYIVVDAFHNIYITGTFQGTIDFDPGPGIFNLTSLSTNIFIAKLESSGNLIWAKAMAGTMFSSSNSLALDGHGNLYTAGYFRGTVDFDPGSGVYNLTSAGDADIFVSKLDSNGDFIWALSIGGPNPAGGSSVAVDTAGNLYITGAFQGVVDFNPGSGINNLSSAGSADIFICKLDSSGNFIWAKSMGGPGFDSGRSIIDEHGNIYTTGFFHSVADFDPGPGIFNLTAPSGSSQVFLSKLNNNGDFMWAKSMGGLYPEDPRSIALDASLNIYTTGNFRDTADFDPDSTVFNLVASSYGYDDIYIHKMSQCSTLIPVTSITPPQCAGTYGSASVLISGGTAPYRFAWNNGQKTSSLTGVTAGIYHLTVTDDIGCTDTLSITISEPDPLGSTTASTTSSNCNGTASAVPTGGTPPYSYNWSNGNLTSVANNLCPGIYYVTITDSNMCQHVDSAEVLKVVGTDPLSVDNQIKLYPNPGSDIFLLESRESLSGITIYNPIGDVILNKVPEPNTDIHQLDLTGHLPGVYVLKVETIQNQPQITRVIIKME